MTKVLLCCLVVSLCITNTVYSLDIEEIVESDEFTAALLSSRLGTDRRYKSLIQIQNAAYRMTERKPNTINKALQTKLLKLLNAAAGAGNTEKVNEIIGQLLYTVFKLESKATLARIIADFKKLLTSGSAGRRRRNTSDKLFDEILKELKNIKGGVTLMFAVDTTGSMREEIDESKQIATDIVNTDPEDVDYILSPFNDPGTGPVQYREINQKKLILKDIDALPATGGGDCEEFTYKGMQDSFDFSPQPGSSMFVFTDAPPKDGTPENVQTLIDTAGYDDIKISFFLNKNPCSSSAGIDTSTFKKVAEETGGTVFTFKAGSKRRRKRRAVSSYSAFVTASLRGTSLIRSQPAAKSVSLKAPVKKPEIERPVGKSGPIRALGAKGVKLPIITTTIEEFNIDSEISFVSVVVNTPRGSGAPTQVKLVDAARVSHSGITKEEAIAFNIENPVPGKWKLTYPKTYSYTISVAFKSPVAIDILYFFPERRNSLIMVSRPMRDTENYMLINMIGGNQIDQSSLGVELLTIENKVIQTLSFVPIKTKSSLKLKVKFTPPGTTRYRVKVSGETKKGYKFERLTNQLITSALVVFKTIRAGDEHSAVLGSPGNRILTFAFVKATTTVTAKFSVRARHGSIASVRGGTGSQRFRRRKVLDIKYNAPSDAKLKGKSDFITIVVEYAGAITTHRLSVLLL